MPILVTGAAGFIGYHVCEALLGRGEQVVGLDNLNGYYDPALKQARLERLRGRNGFSFHRIDIADREALFELVDGAPGIDRIVQLAAQAGVRHSLENPYVYIDANVMGELVVLEACRRLPDFKHLVYASSSSVYGGNRKLPFSVEDPVNQPVSLYAATKRAGELIAYSYAHLYRVPATGLRFFTVYGPWGRPDMSAYIFTRAILSGEPIHVFNRGDMRRDFTFIDTVCAVITDAVNRGVSHDTAVNLAYGTRTDLLSIIDQIAGLVDGEITVEHQPPRPGDVAHSQASDDLVRELFPDISPVPLEIGLKATVDWMRTEA